MPWRSVRGLQPCCIVAWWFTSPVTTSGFNGSAEQCIMSTGQLSSTRDPLQVNVSWSKNLLHQHSKEAFHCCLDFQQKPRSAHLANKCMRQNKLTEKHKHISDEGNLSAPVSHKWTPCSTKWLLHTEPKSPCLCKNIGATGHNSALLVQPLFYHSKKLTIDTVVSVLLLHVASSTFASLRRGNDCCVSTEQLLCLSVTTRNTCLGTARCPCLTHKIILMAQVQTTTKNVLPHFFWCSMKTDCSHAHKLCTWKGGNKAAVWWIQLNILLLWLEGNLKYSLFTTSCMIGN